MQQALNNAERIRQEMEALSRRGQKGQNGKTARMAISRQSADR